MVRICTLIVAALLIGIFGCAKNRAPTETTLPSGIVRQEVWLDDDHRLWIYKPANASGQLPLVLVAPAGSPLFHGMSLTDEDMPEQEPYAKAGCIVVAYDISGPSPEGIGQFMQADGGIADGRKALDYALKNIPEVDPSRVISAGHSSAGTLALQLARADERISACIAYAPCADTLEWLGQDLPDLERAAPGFEEFLRRTSPLQNASELKKPCFIFLADDEDVVNPATVRALAQAAPQADLIVGYRGGHYDSMISHGIPLAVEWLRQKKLVD